MSDFDPSTWSVNFAKADTGFKSYDQGTYFFVVSDHEWGTIASGDNEGQPRLNSSFVFEDGKYDGKAFRQNFTFGGALGIFKGFVIATGVRSAEDLDRELTGPEIMKMVDETRGKRFAGRVQKQRVKKGQEQYGDGEGYQNRMSTFYHIDSPQAQVAANAGTSGGRVDPFAPKPRSKR